MGLLLILGLIVYLVVGVGVGLFSGFIWGSTQRWAGFTLPTWLEWVAVVGSAFLWPLFVAFVAIYYMVKGPFDVGWFT